MCGAPLMASEASTTPVTSSHGKADEVLKKWYQPSVNWVRVAVLQASNDIRTVEDFTKLLLTRQNE
ncbi:hypothetical protein GN958_ATG09436 [Phytophthora infestans]|uniref:Uncharacterized protein n=1 Tax=Phytophthora infestans TaxID=4787 RepID=A0A8S9UKP4_PHYIN|nr:hypothetical protein GN958_ATG09436 [Phytophthora infestans]